MTNTRGYKIFRKLVDQYDITEQEAIGIARWILWLKMDGEY